MDAFNRSDAPPSWATNRIDSGMGNTFGCGAGGFSTLSSAARVLASRLMSANAVTPVTKLMGAAPDGGSLGSGTGT